MKKEEVIQKSQNSLFTFVKDYEISPPLLTKSLVFQIYIEVKRFHTPRTAVQIEWAPDIIVIQGGASMRFLESLISRKGVESTIHGIPDAASM